MKNNFKKKFHEHKYKIAVFIGLIVIILIGLGARPQHQSEDITQEEVVVPPTTETSKYQELKAQNEDYYAWIKIPDTNIDFPVMYKDNTYYLTHDFDLVEDIYGVPFIDERCDIQERSTNLLIHGHSTMSGPIGKMFDDISKYKDVAFYESHPTISFETMEGEQLYEIMMVIESKVFYKNEEGYRYYNFIQADNETEYQNNIYELKQISLYNTGVDTKYGDQLITLSTCDPSRLNGRLALIAKRVDN